MTRDELRAWLDRKPPRHANYWGHWFGWADGSESVEYLGELSARTGPDDVGAKRRCGCEQCRHTDR